MEALARIRNKIESYPVVLFMKGSPTRPTCRYSSQAVQALDACGADFKAIDILEDPEVRANLPKYSNWSTFPQLFIHGELVGGSDVIVELLSQGDLGRMLREANAAAA